jgi:hypothetical protein
MVDCCLLHGSGGCQSYTHLIDHSQTVTGSFSNYQTNFNNYSEVKQSGAETQDSMASKGPKRDTIL